MKILSTLMLGILFCTVLPCEAKALINQSNRREKIHVDSQAIKITKDGIFVLEHGRLIPVGSVSKDSGGIFVEKRYVEPCGRCGMKYDWDKNHHCPACGWMN